VLKRIITSLIAAPIAILVIWLGGVYLQVVAGFLILISMREFYRAFNSKWLPVHFVGFAFAIGYIVFVADFVEGNWFFPFFMLFVMIVFMFLVMFHKRNTALDCAVTVFGFFYICMLLSTVILVRNFEDLGVYVVWLIFFSAWGADTGAYFAGRFFGKRKLAPILSPKKTIEGAIGGVLTAAGISAVYGLVLIHNPLPVQFAEFENMLVWQLALIGAGGAVLSIFGDLAASAIKRHTDVKDFGNLLPGHGGILDRFDSVLFTAPSVYMLVILILM